LRGGKKKEEKQEKFQPKLAKYYEFGRRRHNPYLVETHNQNYFKSASFL